MNAAMLGRNPRYSVSLPKVIKDYKIKESKPNIIDDDLRLKVVHLSKANMLRCCTPVKVGDYVRIWRPDFPPGTVVKEIQYDINWRGFSVLIWNKDFPIWDREAGLIGKYDPMSIHSCEYKIADQQENENG